MGNFIRNETKYMLNTVKRSKKRSSLRIKMNIYIGYSIAINLLLCIFAAFFHIIYLFVWQGYLSAYIDYDNESFFTLFLTRIGNWMVILR